MESPAYSGGLCSGGGGGGFNPSFSGGGGDSEKLIMLLLFSSTSTTIYCISFAGDRDRRGENSRKRRERRRYVSLNLDSLKEDGARGKGEHLAVLAELSGCPASSYCDFSSAVQGRYAELFNEKSAGDSDNLISNLDGMIQEHPMLKDKCKYQF